MRIQRLIDLYSGVIEDTEALASELSREAEAADRRDDITAYLELEEAAGNVQLVADALKHHSQMLQKMLKTPPFHRTGVLDAKYRTTHADYLRFHIGELYFYARELKGLGVYSYWQAEFYNAFGKRIEELAERLERVNSEVDHG